MPFTASHGIFSPPSILARRSRLRVRVAPAAVLLQLLAVALMILALATLGNSESEHEATGLQSIGENDVDRASGSHHQFIVHRQRTRGNPSRRPTRSRVEHFRSQTRDARPGSTHAQQSGPAALDSLSSGTMSVSLSQNSSDDSDGFDSDGQHTSRRIGNRFSRRLSERPAPTPLGIPTKAVPRFDASDARQYSTALKRVSKKLPTILFNAHLTDSANEKWTVEYLKTHFDPNAKFIVNHSRTREFLFWQPNHVNSTAIPFEPPSNITDMTFSDFVSLLRPCDGPGVAGASGTPIPTSTSSDHCGGDDGPDDVGMTRHFHYLNQQLNTFPKSIVSGELRRDVDRWQTSKVHALLSVLEGTSGGNDRDITNMLFVSPAGAATCGHWDRQQNIFQQIVGRKRFIMFDPADVGGLYLYPQFHPHARQMQVNVAAPDFDRFPLFRNVTAHDCIIGPGDTLVLPQYWTHHVETLDETVSINFWHYSEARSRIPIDAWHDYHGVMSSTMRMKFKCALEAFLQDGNVGSDATTAVAGDVQGRPIPLEDLTPFLKGLLSWNAAKLGSANTCAVPSTANTATSSIPSIVRKHWNAWIGLKKLLVESKVITETDFKTEAPTPTLHGWLQEWYGGRLDY